MKSVVFQNKSDIIAAPTAFSPANPEGSVVSPFPAILGQHSSDSPKKNRPP